MSRQNRKPKRNHYKSCAAVRDPLWWLPGRKFWLTGLFVSVIVGFYLAWQWLSDAQRFPVNKIEVNASFQHVERTVLQHSIEPFLTYSFWRLPMQEMQHTLQEIPWVAHVQLQREWPDKLIITVKEHEPIAQWNEESFFTAEGSLFTPGDDTFYATIPRLFGPSGQADRVWEQFQQLNELFAQLTLQVQELVLTNTRAWQVRLSNGMVLLLGQDAVEQRLERFIKTYDALFAEKSERVAYVDLRYSNGMAVRWLD